MAIRSLCAVLLLLATAGTAAAATPAYRDPPTYRGPRVAPPVVERTPPAIPLSQDGTFPSVLVDDAGTAHIVWNEGRGDQDDAAMYCRIKRGGNACEGGAIALTWQKEYGAGDSPSANIDNFGPKIVRLGDQLVVLSKRYPTIGEKPDGASSSTVVAWTSADGGRRWTDARVVGRWNIESTLVAGEAGDPTLLTLGHEPFCPDGTAGMCLVAYRSGEYARESLDLATGRHQHYEGSLALDASGRPVAVWHDLAQNVFVRRHIGTGSFTDPANWTAPGRPLKGVELALAGGPAGLFLMSKPGFLTDYQLRRLDARDNAGPYSEPVRLSYRNSPAFEQLIQDPSGRLMAAWVDREGRSPGVQLRVSRPLSGPAATAPGVPLLDPAETMIAGAKAGQIALAATADGGGFVVANRTGGVNSPGEIVATAMGATEATNRPGLGGLTGGAGQTNDCGKIRFGALDIESDTGGCFLLGQGANADKYVTRGALDLFGLKIVPDAGVRIVLNPRTLTIDAVEGNGKVRVIVSAPVVGDITLWHGTFHRDLKSMAPGTELFSFDSSQYAAKILGFDIARNISGRINGRGDGVDIPVSLKLPAGFGGAAADALLRATKARGLEVESLKLRFGPVPIGIATLERFELDYLAAEELWSGLGEISFTGFGKIGAKAEFRMGQFRRAAVSFEPAVPPKIGPFVYLLRAGVEFGVAPLFVELNGAVGGGVAAQGEAPIRVDGRARFTVPDNGPAEFLMSGALSAARLQVATGTLRFQTDGYADFKGEVGQDFTVISVKGRMDGFVDATNGDWGASVNGEVCVGLGLGCLGNMLAASNAGVAACGTIFGASGGVRMSWDEVRDLAASIASTVGIPVVGQVNAARLIINALAIPCTTDGFYKPPPRPRTRARAAQAGAHVVTVRGGLPTATIAVFGDGGPPQVDVAGPGGARPALRTIPVPQAHATLLVVDAPAAGDLTITPREGSPAITELLQSDGFRPASATARVTGTGRVRTLRYRARGLSADSTVTFLERAPRGTRRLGDARAAAGVIGIRPSLLPGGPREVVAEVRRKGEVLSRTTVARYRATGPARVRAAGALRAVRAGRSVRVLWRPAPGAVRHRVRLAGPGTSQLRATTGRSATFTSIARSAALTAEVRGIGADGRMGPARRVLLRAAR